MKICCSNNVKYFAKIYISLPPLDSADFQWEGVSLEEKP